MTSSSQPGAPEPPHRLGALTTSELSAYRRQLEGALKDRTIGSAPIAGDLRARLSEVAAEEAERERHRNSRQRWPIKN